MIHGLFDSNMNVILAHVEPWVRNPNMLGAILGSAVGVFGGLYGTLAGSLAPRGKAKGIVMGMHWAGVALGLAVAAKFYPLLIIGPLLLLGSRLPGQPR